MDIDFPFELNEMAIVLDGGGYHGDFAALIREKYKAPVHIFEPVFVRHLKDRFSQDPLCWIFDCALLDVNTTMEIDVTNNSSSLFDNRGTKQQIKVRDIGMYIQAQALPHIDLIKLNVEGAEYAILNRLHEMDYIKNIKHIVVQFHPLEGQSQEEQENRLAKTHKIGHKCDHWTWFIRN